MGPKPHFLVFCTLTALAFGDPRGVTCATLRVTCHRSAVELLVKQLHKKMGPKPHFFTLYLDNTLISRPAGHQKNSLPLRVLPLYYKKEGEFYYSSSVRGGGPLAVEESLITFVCVLLSGRHIGLPLRENLSVSYNPIQNRARALSSWKPPCRPNV